MSKGIECPHCGEGITKSYAVKSLMILAKSEGQELDGELEQFLDEAEPADGEAEKGLKKPKAKGEKAVEGNQVASHRGKAPGAMHSSSRASSGEAVERTHRPTNPTNEKGMKKSVSFPVADQFNLVSYSDGADQAIAKSIEEGSVHEGPANNGRAQRERATGKLTAE